MQDAQNTLKHTTILFSRMSMFIHSGQKQSIKLWEEHCFDISAFSLNSQLVAFLRLSVVTTEELYVTRTDQ